ncbi:hypothetical protein E8E11_003732 [Didymella keratinophila]|nr:hypothetical protein E8E11_003732 [Didymella keratinophila]
MRSLCLETTTAKAFNALSELMVEMRHQSVEDIQSGFHSIINDIEHEFNEKYIIADRQTKRSVYHSQLDLMRTVGNTKWWNCDIAQILKLDEEDALEHVSWIAAPEDAPPGCAPEDWYLSIIPQESLPDLPSPVGRDSYIEMLRGLGEISLAQMERLRKTIEHLLGVPAAASHGNVGQEAESIARVKRLLRDY